MDEEKAMLWQQRIQECLSSGLSVKRWCKENHVSSPTFYYWKNRLEKEQGEISEKTMPVFGVSEFCLHGEDITLFQNENRHLIDEKIREVAYEFSMDAEDILGYVLVYRFDMKRQK